LARLEYEVLETVMVSELVMVAAERFLIPVAVVLDTMMVPPELFVMVPEL